MGNFDQSLQAWVLSGLFLNKGFQNNSTESGPQNAETYYNSFYDYLNTINLWYTNGFFLLVRYTKLRIVNCTHLGMSGYN